MKSQVFNSILMFLIALLPFAFAGDYESASVSTYFSTKTVYLVHTETKTGTPPASSSTSYNSTSTEYPPSYGTTIPTFSSSANATLSSTGYYPTGTGVPTSTTTAPPTFTGAASQLNVNALVAAIAVGVGYLAL